MEFGVFKVIRILPLRILLRFSLIIKQLVLHFFVLKYDFVLQILQKSHVFLVKIVKLFFCILKCILLSIGRVKTVVDFAVNDVNVISVFDAMCFPHVNVGLNVYFVFHVMLQETVVTTEALINVSQIISLHLNEKSIQNVDWRLLIAVFQWNIFPLIMEVINKLVNLDASFDDQDLHLFNIFC